MNNEYAIVLSPYAPSLKNGGGIAALSSLKVYSKFYKQVHYIYFGRSDQDFPYAYENVVFHKVPMNYQKKLIRFFLSFFIKVPAVCVSYRKKSIVSRIDYIINDISKTLKTNENISVLFEDLPVACFLSSLKKRYPNWRYAVRSQNVMAKIFYGFTTNKEGYGLIFRKLMKYECHRNYLYEKKILTEADRVWAISEEDKNQYNFFFGYTCDGVFSIYYDNPNFEKVKNKDSFSILHLGGIDLRKKNGMQSFIDNSWLKIKGRYPNAKLVLGGTNTELFNDKSKDIYGLGFVDDEVEFFSRGLIFINTQTVGSGIKLKSIVSVLAGKLLVSTEVGVEGVSGEDGKHYLVAANCHDFANKIIDALIDIEHSKEIAKAGKLYFVNNYNFENLYRKASKLLLALVRE